MPYKDMREFLDVLREDGQLKDCDVPIKAAYDDNELQALMRLLCQNDGPALMLTFAVSAANVIFCHLVGGARGWEDDESRRAVPLV